MGFRSNIPPYAMLRAFDAYAQNGRVRRAATELGVSHAIVSRHLSALEQWLGVMLIDRKKGGLTPVGQEYHQHITLALDTIGAATDRIAAGTSARISVWCVPGLAYHWLRVQLPHFNVLHPATEVDFRPTDMAPDLLRRQADADIRWIMDGDNALVPSGLRAEDLVRPRYFPVACPQAPWLGEARLSQAADILRLPLLHEDSDREWRAWLAAYDIGDAPPRAAARLGQAHMTLAAAAEGQGVALTNEFLASDLLKSGRLVEIGIKDGDPGPVTFGAYRFAARHENWDFGPCAWFRKWMITEMTQRTVD